MNRIIAETISDFSLDNYRPILQRDLSLGTAPNPVSAISSK